MLNYQRIKDSIDFTMACVILLVRKPLDHRDPALIIECSVFSESISDLFGAFCSGRLLIFVVVFLITVINRENLPQ